MTVQLVGIPTNQASPLTVQSTVIKQLVNNQQISVAPPVTFANQVTYRMYSLQNTTPLQHASGEQHVISYSSTYSTWQANYAYTVGTIVQPPTANGNYYTCITAGTSGATQPSWPSSGTVTDYGVTWAANVSVPFIGAIRLDHLPAANTSIGVRGVSVTVRALWIQPRHGSAWLYDSMASWPTGEKLRSLNERWQAKTLTAILPEVQD
jgi:hypothetical protein